MLKNAERRRHTQITNMTGVSVMTVVDFIRFSTVTDKDQLFHLSGSLINSQNDQENSPVSWARIKTF
jgi:hypothetical protein